MKVTFLVNGPGELWGWARPLSRELICRGWQVFIEILPCPFASGREYDVAEKLDVSSVKGPHNWFQTLISFENLSTDLVVQLGGDLLFGRYLAWRKKAPLVCYTYGEKKGLAKCDLVATAFSSMAKKISEPSYIVGDLVMDGLKERVRDYDWKDSGPKVVFFPGSRPDIRKVALGYIKKVVKEMGKLLDFQFISLMSPFTSPEEYRLWREEGLNPQRLNASDALRNADLAVTQPGTNTLEILHASVPAVVAVPFAFLKNIPLSGLKGWIFKMPGGAFLKDYALRKASKKAGFLAWPNRIAGREIMPEFVGDLEPPVLAHHIYHLLSDRERLVKIVEELKNIRSPHSPAKALCDELERLVASYNEK